MAPCIACPTLLVAGSEDRVTPREDAARLAERIPDARMIVLPAAHLANVEAPDDFTAAVVDFLSSPEERRGRT
jgi:3-oxoadipate enol-lactonase